MSIRRTSRSSMTEQEDEPETSEPRLKPVSKGVLEKIRSRLAERASKQQQNPQRLAPPQPPPRYDEVFAEGQRWLDSLAGDAIACETITISY